MKLDKAIPMHCFQDLAMALPKCKITAPEENLSWILDKEGGRIGDINWETASIGIYEGYEYFEAVVNSIGKNKFIDVRKEFETDTTDYDASAGVPEGVTDRIIKQAGE